MLLNSTDFKDTLRVKNYLLFKKNLARIAYVGQGVY
jgi:hypothetical protein